MTCEIGSVQLTEMLTPIGNLPSCSWFLLLVCLTAVQPYLPMYRTCSFVSYTHLGLLIQKCTAIKCAFSDPLVALSERFLLKTTIALR